MICPHCIAHIHYEPTEIGIINDGTQAFCASKYICPNCNNAIIYLIIYSAGKKLKEILIYPKIPSRIKFDNSTIPSNIFSDYIEACSVLSDSPKASAALSRRCLQNIIREYFKIKRKDLNKEIDELLTIGLPSHLSEDIDAIRQIGNYATHPIKYEQSGEIVEVEPGEAEWSLEVLEMLFDFCYVQPKKAEERRTKMNEKLESLGKPELKIKKDNGERKK